MDKFRRQNTLTVVVLSIITLGIYEWIWFLNQWPALQNLSPRPRIKSSKEFISGMLILSAIFALLRITRHLLHINSLTVPIGVIALILLYGTVKVSFEFRHVVLGHLKERKQELISYFSPVFTLVFGPVYLQYKLNNPRLQGDGLNPSPKETLNERYARSQLRRRQIKKVSIVVIGAFLPILAILMLIPTRTNEAKVFSEGTDSKGCVDEALKREGPESSLVNSYRTSNFLLTCLDYASQTPGFCDSIPRPEKNYSWTWANSMAQKYGLNGTFSPMIFKQIQKHCYMRKFKGGDRNPYRDKWAG